MSSHAPTGLTVTGFRSTQFIVNWHDYAGATAYHIEYRVTGTTSWTRDNQFINSSAALIRNLQAETQYDVRVRAVTASGNSPWTSPVSAYTSLPTTPPNAPTAVTVRTRDHSSIQVTWVTPTGGGLVVSYSIRHRVRGTSTWTNITGVTGNIRNVTGLTSSTEYEFQMQAINANGASSWVPATPVRATTQASPLTRPSPPTAITLTAQSHHTIRVSWGASPIVGNNEAATYTIRHREDGTSAWTTVSGLTGRGRDITGLSGSTTYEFQMRAVNAAGVSDWTPITPAEEDTLAAPPPAPSIPTSISLTTIDFDSMLMNWSAPTTGGSAFTYDVQYRIRGTTAWTIISDIDGTSRQIHGLTPNTIYQGQVRAKNVSGTSDWAPLVPDETRTSPPPAAAPGIPRNIRSQFVTHESIRLVWLTPASGGAPDNYNIRYRILGDTDWSLVEDVRGTTYTITGLRLSLVYEIQVQSSNLSGQSGWAPDPALQVRTRDEPPGAPNVPIGITANTVDHDSIIVAWAAPVTGDPASSYSLRYRILGTDRWTEVHGITDTNRQVNGLSPAKVYQVQVQSTNGFGSSVWAPGTLVFAVTTPGPDNIIPDLIELDYQILIDWDGDGTFSHPLADVYMDVEKHNGINASRGRYFRGTQFPRAAAGELEFTLRNDKGKFNPLGPQLGSLVETKKRIQVRMRPR